MAHSARLCADPTGETAAVHMRPLVACSHRQEYARWIAEAKRADTRRVNTGPGRASAAPGAQDDIGDVAVIGRRVDAGLDRVQLDREFAAQQPAEVVRIDIVRRVDAP